MTDAGPTKSTGARSAWRHGTLHRRSAFGVLNQKSNNAEAHREGRWMRRAHRSRFRDMDEEYFSTAAYLLQIMLRAMLV
jgi:hypothetical protein